MRKKSENQEYCINNTFLAERIKLTRKWKQLSQEEASSLLRIPLDRYQQIEMGRITAIPYFRNFLQYYGETLTMAIFTVNWLLYTGERLRTYLGHSGYAHPRAAVVEMHISPMSLNRILLRENENSILYHYKPAMDRMFGDLIRNPDSRLIYAVGKNSEYRYDNDIESWILAIGQYFVPKNKPYDTNDDCALLKKEVIAIKNKLSYIEACKSIHIDNEDEIISALQEHQNNFSETWMQLKIQNSEQVTN